MNTGKCFLGFCIIWPETILNLIDILLHIVNVAYAEKIGKYIHMYVCV